MDHADHVGLLRDAVDPGGHWADIGAGDGAFTLALADLLGPGGTIVAIDRDPGALARNVESTRMRFPGVALTTLTADFTRAMELPTMDGLVAANSLHFVPRDHQLGVIAVLAEHLRPGGRFVVVEYDADHGNPWVPNPFGATSWANLATAVGLVDPRPLGRIPSRFLGAIYSAVAVRP